MLICTSQQKLKASDTRDKPEQTTTKQLARSCHSCKRQAGELCSVADSRAKPMTLAAQFYIDDSCTKSNSRFTEEEALLRVWEKSGIWKAILVVLFLVLLQFSARYCDKFFKATAFNITQESNTLKKPRICSINRDTSSYTCTVSSPLGHQVL